MQPYPVPTTREQKLAFARSVKDRLLSLHGDAILAIGIYGSLGRGTDGPYSDIELHVVTQDNVPIQGHEFILPPFKLELSSATVTEFREKARRIDDYWPIRSGSYVDVYPLHDPLSLFEEVKKIPLSVSDEAVKETMKQFMIWEPYETVAKIRTNRAEGNLGYLPTGATDLAWQTAKLIGLANRRYFSTRARTLTEAAAMASKPAGFSALATAVTAGELSDRERVYGLCEELWTGLNDWFSRLGISYMETELPF
ncbi:kanamycin nucleotidyltransferase C-terminal domain-containing protein [Cohnella candidum]|uniref:KNTase domain-containing protein n=1 Tax=Cohnella candidum TaxID=2674991 RepID=A0A3G3JXD3_9BACL|nr:kanamycin nucleotidyltransferase C-terminal domain-containing protein [Cohnella candidum]AYQ72896.1 KNTase domain-containing protein [Cohnella candidum]